MFLGSGTVENGSGVSFPSVAAGASAGASSVAAGAQRLGAWADATTIHDASH